MKVLDMPIEVVVQHIKAPNTIYGNPNRIFHVYDRCMNYLGWIDEGYSGTRFARGRTVTWLADMQVNGTRRYKTGKQLENKGV